MRVLFALVLGCSAVACNLDNPGDDPPRAMLYFPNALALSPHGEGERARYLYVVNSDFDLRYNAGTVQAYSLDDLEEEVRACELGRLDAAGGAGRPACIIETEKAFETEVRIPAFSTAIASSKSGERLLITTRTGESLTSVRADPTGSGEEVLRCVDGCGAHGERGLDRYRGGQLDFPEEPVAVLAGQYSPSDGVAALADDEDEYALVAHRSSELSLFVEQGDGLQLADRLAPVALGATTDLAHDANTGLVHATVSYPVQGRALARFGVSVPEVADAADPSRASLFNAGGVVLQPFDDFRDTRAIAFLPPLSDPTATDPLMAGLAARNDAVIVAQRPSALLLADVATDVDRREGFLKVARVKGSTLLGAGASRLAVGVIDGIPVAAVACFDSREVALVDLRTMLTRSVVPNLSGPYGIVLDEERKLVYVTDFRSSVIRILDVAPALEPGGSDPVEVVATLGRPRVLQELR